MVGLPFPGLRLSALGVLAPTLLALATGCSLINAPDEIVAGGNGGGGAGTGANGGATTTGGGGQTGCTTNEDCASLTNACATGECGPDKVCVAAPQPAGTTCGNPAAGQCDLQDTCDGAGNCVDATVADGTFCTDCPAGEGNCKLCSAGACGDCTTRAALKTFRTPMAASGWTFTGGWGIYEETPPENTFGGPTSACSDGLDNDGDGKIDLMDPGCADAADQNEFDISACNDNVDSDGDGLIDLADPQCSGPGDDTEYTSGPVRFNHPVLGTDGNRKHPYGLNGASELETSSATSPPTVLPAKLQFLSWHKDEGFYFDLKAVQVSLDGVSFTTVAICPQGNNAPYAFCQPVNPNIERTPDQWDPIELDVPPGFIGQVGYVRFLYDTTDGCCGFERGWYVDALNFAQDCACAADADCGYATSECGGGHCDGDECTLTPTNSGNACAAAGTTAECSTATCSDNGFCATGFLAHEQAACGDCSDPDGQCTVCVNADCLSCPAVQTVVNLNTAGFVFTGDWNFQYCLAPNSVAPNDGSTCFPNAMAIGDLNTAPVLGSNGSRTGANPWNNTSETMFAQMVTAPSLVPATLQFKSWHQDRGGNDTFNPADKKTIRVSVDNGATWTVLVDCDGNNDTAFCIPSTAFQNKAASAWDDISIDVPTGLVGQMGIFEFTYDTVNSGQGWERGWFIDDLNINRCSCNSLTCQ